MVTDTFLTLNRHEVWCADTRPGVCLGNWVETRAASSQLSLPARFDATTTMRADYSPTVRLLLCRSSCMWSLNDTAFDVV